MTRRVIADSGVGTDGRSGAAPTVAADRFGGFVALAGTISRYQTCFTRSRQ